MSESNEPLFCLKDVCSILGLQVNKVKERLNSKGMELYSTPSKGGMQDTTFISESNLYRCVLQSRKKFAVRFQDWIVEDVLPALRQNKMYVLEQTNQSLNTQNTFLMDMVAENAHKVQIAESMMKTNLHYVRDVANYINQAGYKCGQNILYIWLRNNGWCYLNGYNTNVATGYAVKNGWLVNSYDDGNVTVKVTPKGFDKLCYLYTHNQSDDTYQKYLNKISEPELPLVFE